MVVDPVCGMRLAPATAVATADSEGTRVYFCSDLCRYRFLANPAAYRTTSSHQTRRRHSCSDGVGHTSSRSTRAALGMAAGAGLTATAILLSFYFGALTLISGWSFTVQQCRAPRIWQRLRHLAATRAMTNGLWHGKAIYPAAITARAYWCSNRSVRCRGRSRSTSVKWEAFLNARSRGPLPAHKAKRSHNSRRGSWISLSRFRLLSVEHRPEKKPSPLSGCARVPR